MAGKKMNVEKIEKFCNVLIISGLTIALLQANNLLYRFCLGTLISPYVIILNALAMCINIFAGTYINLSRERLKRSFEKRTDNTTMMNMVAMMTRQSNEIAGLKMANEDLRKSLDEEIIPKNDPPKEEVVGRKIENAMEGLGV